MRFATVLTLLALATGNARADEDAPAAAEEATPPAAEPEPAPPAALPPEETPPEPEAPAPQAEPAGDPPLDPSAPLQRFRRATSRWTRSADEEPASPPAGSDDVPAAAAPEPQDGGPSLQLRLRNGQVVDGVVVAQTAEGWVLRLPGGETRFFDRLDVVSDSGPRPERPSMAQKVVLSASLIWPGAGQVLYGGLVQHGPPWQRSALVVGVLLVAVAVVGALVAGVGITVGLAAPTVAVEGITLLGGPLNPITLAGAVAVVLAAAVGLLDAGARVILD
ncbi:MAG: hypothetical protein HY904_13365 [Deltaproteobacteria bacterium]|nr:hypothetical protein [Deltaproteobacteria bacterium]